MSKPPHEMTGSLLRGAHACHLFSTAGQQKQILLPFCQQGLKRNEFVSLTASADTIDDWQLELQAYGIDVQAERERGALMIKGIGEPSADFNPVRQARNLWRMVQPMLERFAAVRLVRAQPWSAEALTIEDLCHFELTKNLLFQDTDVRSVCQYDLTNHSPQAIHTALRTHPLVILDGMLRENPFYDGDAILKQEPAAFGSDADAQAVEQMLASLR